eukprot:744261-Alexandrium_andersonii.AAC.1
MLEFARRQPACFRGRPGRPTWSLGSECVPCYRGGRAPRKFCECFVPFASPRKRPVSSSAVDGKWHRRAAIAF